MAKKKFKIVHADPVTFQSIIEMEDGERIHLGASYQEGDWDRACELTGLGCGQLLQKIDREMDKRCGRKPDRD